VPLLVCGDIPEKGQSGTGPFLIFSIVFPDYRGRMKENRISRWRRSLLNGFVFCIPSELYCARKRRFSVFLGLFRNFCAIEKRQDAV
jgi:hypothetical protein